MIERTSRQPVLKSLFLGEADEGCGTLLSQTHLAAEEMKHNSKEQRESQTKGVGNLQRQRHRCLALCQPLVRIAQRPQRPGGKTVTHHASIFPIQERRGTMLLGIVERDAL